MSMHVLQPAIDYLNGRIAEWQSIVGRLVALRDGQPLGETPVVSLPDRSPVAKITATPPQKVRRRCKKRGGFAAHPLKLEKGKAREVSRPTIAAPAGAKGIELEKPETVGGAMKYLARRFKKPFTVTELTEAMKADEDFEKLLEDSGPTVMSSNLFYWTKTGRLKKVGEGADATYEVVDLDF